jgi:uncharacterized cupin superfamily protein
MEPNVFDVEVEYWAEDPEGYKCAVARLAPLVGGSMLGISVYELPAGQSICPYHYEYGNEEWLVALQGPVVVRTPEGSRELRAGDTVCFPPGLGGAHKVTNRGEETVRVLMLSTKDDPAVAVYPDSDKIGVWTGNEDDHVMARRSSHVDYWDGEI